MPSVSSYWEHGTRFPPIADIIPHNQFEKIMRLLHFTGNNEANDKAKQAKVWKIRPWLDELQRNFLTVEPKQLNSIDKLMISFYRKMPYQAVHACETAPLGHKTVGTGRFIWLSLSVQCLPRTSKEKLPVWSGRRRYSKDLPGSARKQRIQSSSR